MSMSIKGSTDNQNSQTSIFDYIEPNEKELILTSNIQQDDITMEIEKAFDYKSDNGIVTETIKIPRLPDHYQIGLIVGSSGSGKSTILSSCLPPPRKNHMGQYAIYRVTL